MASVQSLLEVQWKSNALTLSPTQQLNQQCQPLVALTFLPSCHRLHFSNTAATVSPSPYALLGFCSPIKR